MMSKMNGVQIFCLNLGIMRHQFKSYRQGQNIKTTQRTIVIKRKGRWLGAVGNSTLIFPNCPGGTSKMTLGLQGAQSDNLGLLWDANFIVMEGTQLRENERRYYKVIKHIKYISSRDIYFRIGLDIVETVNTRLRKSLTFSDPEIVFCYSARDSEVN